MSAVADSTQSASDRRGDPKVAVALRSLTKQFGRSTAVDGVELTIREGEFFALLGPSGCGKTTTLKMIGGFERPTSGDILVHGVSVVDMPPFKRNVNTVFQNYALFPHLNVRDNVAFSLRMQGVGRSARAAAADAALARVGLERYGDRKVHQLSGGEQQRVALARALISEPAVVLLDEPLGALDLQLRKSMQAELKSIQHSVGITFVYVTHDQEEALTMADRIGVMNGGRLLQVGSPVEIYEQPTSRFVASFIGESSFLDASVDAVDAGGVYRLRTDAGVELSGVTAFDHEVAPGQRVAAVVRPEKVRILLDADTSPMEAGANRLEGVVHDQVYVGSDIRYVVQTGAGTLTARVSNTGDGQSAARRVIGAGVEVTFPISGTVVVASDGDGSTTSAGSRG